MNELRSDVVVPVLAGRCLSPESCREVVSMGELSLKRAGCFSEQFFFSDLQTDQLNRMTCLWSAN